MRAFIYLILGAVLMAAGIFWYNAIGFSVLAIIAALVIASGGALIVAAIAIGLDKHSPTSRKL